MYLDDDDPDISDDDADLAARILRFAVKWDEAFDEPARMDVFSTASGESTHEVVSVVEQLYPLLDYGTSGYFPWVGPNGRKEAIAFAEELEERHE